MITIYRNGRLIIQKIHIPINTKYMDNGHLHVVIRVNKDILIQASVTAYRWQ